MSDGDRLRIGIQIRWIKETRKVIAGNRREISPDVDRERQDGFEFRIHGNSVAGQAIEEILKMLPHGRCNNYGYCRQGYYVLQASLPGLQQQQGSQKNRKR